MNIALSTDHAGFEQLKDIQFFLESIGHTCINFGPKTLNLTDDYPEAMAANRLKGIRCGVFYGPTVVGRIIDANGRVSSSPYEIVRLSRMHNDANMLSIAARFVTLNDIQQVIRLWLDTPFSGEERHARRIKKLDDLIP
jgi:ribose 5-phosphate isomerase B